MDSFADLSQLSVPTLIALGATLGVDMVIKECIVEIVRTALRNKQGRTELAATANDSNKDDQGQGSSSGSQSGAGLGVDSGAGKDDEEGTGSTPYEPPEAAMLKEEEERKAEKAAVEERQARGAAEAALCEAEEERRASDARAEEECKAREAAKEAARKAEQEERQAREAAKAAMREAEEVREAIEAATPQPAGEHQAKCRIKRKRWSSRLPGEPLPNPRPAGAAAPATGVASRWLSAGEASAPSAAGGQLVAAGRRVISMQAKQSGVPGVSWEASHNCWRVSWPEEGRRRAKIFPVLQYMAPAKTHKEAEAEALRAAIAFRKELALQGKIKVVRAKHVSNIKGVGWDTVNKVWRVSIMLNGKALWGGRFRPKDGTPEEIERARLAAVERRRKLELEHCQFIVREAPRPDQLTGRDSGVEGVSWAKYERLWRVHVRFNGKRGKGIMKRFRPKDDTPEEIEQARLAAVQCRQELECQRDKHLATKP